MTWSGTVRQINAHQRATGVANQFAAADADIKRQTAEFQHRAATTQWSNPFGGAAAKKPAPHGGPRKPVKRIIVPPAHPGSIGSKIAKAGQGGGVHPKPGGGVHGTPGRPGGVIGAPPRAVPGGGGHPVHIEPDGAQTWWEVLLAILRGAVRAGDAVLLVVTGVGEIYVHITDPIVTACRNVGRQAPPLSGSGIEFEHWLNEHWILASTGIPIVLGLLSGAAFR